MSTGAAPGGKNQTTRRQLQSSGLWNKVAPGGEGGSASWCLQVCGFLGAWCLAVCVPRQAV